MPTYAAQDPVPTHPHYLTGPIAGVIRFESYFHREGPVEPDPIKVLNQYLAEKGMKQTRKRQAIVSTFFRTKKHIKIEELLEEVRKVEPSVGYVTVYRTLLLLKECGLAHQRHFGDGQSLYEKAGEHHDHMICIKCGAISEFEDDRIEDVQEEIARSRNCKIVSHRHEIYGCCAKCQKE